MFLLCPSRYNSLISTKLAERAEMESRTEKEEDIHQSPLHGDTPIIATNDKQTDTHRLSYIQATTNFTNRNSILKLLSTSALLLILSILPQNFVSSEPDCGINRFNNESPLTERIVGGNNSLQ